MIANLRYKSRNLHIATIQTRRWLNMGLLLSASHQVLKSACQKAFQRYTRQANQLENVQRQKLNPFFTPYR